MYALEVIAKPVFGKAASDWLVNLRETRAHSPGAPEFTLVFPGSEPNAEAVVQHVEAVCAATPRIRFCLRSAIVVPDMGAFHVFLVPDEGFGAIIRLHDRLHVGPLASCLRPDVPYIPHLTVATVQDLGLARRMKASVNVLDLAIAGHIDEIEVRRRECGTSPCIARASLARRSLFR